MPKYAINTYTGCDCGCIYCYAVLFRGKVHRDLEGKPMLSRKVEPRKYLPAQLRREIKPTTPRRSVYLCPLTEPFSRHEKRFRITTKVMEILIEEGFPLILLTKSNIASNWAEMLKEANAVVSFSIPIYSDELSSLVEPYAPPPSERFEEMEKLSERGVNCILRIQPIIPFVSDREDNLERLIEEAKERGAKYVAAGTLKLVKETLPLFEHFLGKEICEQVSKIYLGLGEKRWRYYYAPKSIRREIAERVARIAKKHGFSIGLCREGFPDLCTASCDGQHLLH